MIYKNIEWTDMKEKSLGATSVYYQNSCEGGYCFYKVTCIIGEIQYSVELFKNEIPLSCYMTQEQNDEFKLDFETNFKGTVALEV